MKGSQNGLLLQVHNCLIKKLDLHTMIITSITCMIMCGIKPPKHCLKMGLFFALFARFYAVNQKQMLS